MTVNNPLNEIFSNGSAVRILRQLAETMTPVTGRECARRSNLSHRTAIENLNGLESTGVVNRIFGGRDHLFSLNRENLFVKDVLIPVFEQERKLKRTLFKLIAEHYKDIATSILLFGSVARGEDTPESDLDICIIVPDESTKQKIEKRTVRVLLEVKQKFGVTLSNILLTEKEFRNGIDNQIELYQNIVNESKLLFGTSIKEIMHGKALTGKESK